jgi:hypothetical protein
MNDFYPAQVCIGLSDLWRNKDRLKGRLGCRTGTALSAPAVSLVGEHGGGVESPAAQSVALSRSTHPGIGDTSEFFIRSTALYCSWAVPHQPSGVHTWRLAAARSSSTV